MTGGGILAVWARRASSHRSTGRRHTLQSVVVLWSIVALLAMAGRVGAMTPEETEHLVIVVRDTAGVPLSGVGIELYVAGPPHELTGQGLTDKAGMLHFLVAPSDYIVMFVDDWQEIAFLSPAEQNGGTQTSGAVGGFGVHLDPQLDGANHVVTFVVARNTEGELVPLFDLSRDTDLSPEPYLMQEQADEETYLGEALVLDLDPLVDVTAEHPAIANTRTPTLVHENDSLDAGAPETGRPLLFLIFLILLSGFVLITLVAVIVRRYRSQTHG